MPSPRKISPSPSLSALTSFLNERSMGHSRVRPISWGPNYIADPRDLGEGSQSAIIGKARAAAISYFPAHGLMMAAVPSFATIEPDNGETAKLVGSQTKWRSRERRQSTKPARQER